MESKPGEVGSQAIIDAVLASIQPRTSNVFPLPLSPMEKFLWWDDSPEHPLNILFELRFDGALDPRLLQIAWGLAAHLHPLLVSTISVFQGELCWCYQPSARPLLETFSSLNTWLGGDRFDLTRDCGLQGWLGSDREGDRLVVRAHHACCDGIGLRSFLIDLLVLYALLFRHQGLATPANIALLESELGRRAAPELLRERFDFSTLRSGPPKQQLSIWQRILNAHYFHCQPPAPLRRAERSAVAGPSQAMANEPGGVATGVDGRYLTRAFDRGLTQRVIQRCRVEHVGVNEVALAILFRTCARWHRLSQGAKPSRRIRLLMPYSLLSRVDRRLPAANRLSFSFLGRNEGNCDDLWRLAFSIRREIQQQSDTRLPFDFLHAIRAAARWPRIMKWGLKRSRNMCTAVLTYGGSIARGRKHALPIEEGMVQLGNCRLKHVFGVPPVRSNTNIAIGLCLSGGALCVGQAWSHAVFDRQQAEDFQELFCEGWEHLLE